MPALLSDEDVGLSQDLSDNDVGLGATPQQLAAFSLAQGMTIPAKVASMYQIGAASQRKSLQESEVPVLDPETQMPVAYQTDASTSPVGGEYLRAGAQYGLKKAQELQESGGTVLSELYNQSPFLPGHIYPGRPSIETGPISIGASPLELVPGGRELKSGIEKGLGKVVSGFTDPNVAWAAPFAEAAPVQAMFGLQAAAEVPESIRQLYQARTPAEFGEAGIGAAANLAMGGLIGRHLLTGKGLPNARSIEETAKVYGDLFPQSQQGAEGVPAQGRGAGVLTPAQAVAEAAQVPLKVLDADELLNPEHTTALQRLAGNLGLRGEIQVVPNVEGDVENIRTFTGSLAQMDENGNFLKPGGIRVSADAFRNWMETRDPRTLTEALGSALTEEVAHTFTTPKEAYEYGKTLTGFERTQRSKLYMGEHTPESLAEAGIPWNEAVEGAELVRQRIQELMRLRPNEIIERAKNQRDQWSKDGIYILTRIVRRIREFFGTEAARAGQKISYEILDRMERNVNAASEAMGEEAPFLITRKDAAADFEKKSGFTFNPAKQVGGISFEGLSPEQVKALKDAGYGPQWEFTDRRKGSPTEGLTFYVPENSTPEQINAAYQRKLEAEPQAAAMVRRGKEEERPKQDYIGDTSQGSVKGVPVKSSISELHREHGLGEGGWRYVADKNIVYWDVSNVSPEQQHSVENFLAKRGVENPRHKVTTQQDLDEWVFGASMLRRAEDDKRIETPEAFKRTILEEARKDAVGKSIEGALNKYLDALIKRQPITPEMQAGKQLANEISMRQLGIPVTDAGELSAQMLRRRQRREEGGGEEPKSEWAKWVNLLDALTPEERRRAIENLDPERPGGPTPKELERWKAKLLQVQLMRKVGDSSAMLRRKEGKDEPVLPGMEGTKGKGVLSRPETAPATERPPIEQREPATPLAVDRASEQHFADATATGKPITFKKYAEEMRVKFGPMSTEALVESFERSLWPALMNASGEDLAGLRDKMDLRNILGSRDVADPVKAPTGFRLEGEATDPVLVREGKKRGAAAQKYRNNVISSIATKLLGEAVSQAKSPVRTEVSPYDLWKDRDRRTGKMKQKAPVQPIYNELTENERASPTVLGKVLTDDASDMKAATRSATKRLTVLVNKETGKVEMVSTFRDPRRGAVLLDPMHPNQKHQPLESILKRYRPVASVLLDDPVKSFRKSFDSLADYEAQFGAEARSAGQKSFAPPPLAEGERSLPSAYDANAPITRSEAEAIIPHIESELGVVDSPEAVKASLISLGERLAQRTKALSRGYARGVVPEPEEFGTRKAASAYLKIITALAEKLPDASAEELLDKLANQIYENHNTAPDFETFVNRTMAQGSPEAGEAVPTVPLAANVPKGPESVIPKISVEPRVVPGGRPGAFIPKEQPSAMLSPESQAHVQSMAERRYPSLERAPEEVGDGPEETAQMITRRDVRDRAEAAFWTSLGQIRSMFLRHGTKQDIAREAASASTRPINLSQGAKRNIELSSASKKNPDGDLKILAAARAINAAYVMGVPEHAALADLWQLTQDGQAKASQLLATPTDATLAALGLGDITGASKGEIMSMARQWLHAAEDLQKEVEYAQDHFGERDLMRTTRALRLELRAQLLWERNHGRNTKEAENYLPGLYKGEVYGDNSVTFASRILGRQFGKPKSFANTYEAIANGPFIPKLNNVAEIAAHRIRSGLNAVLSDQAFRAPLHMIDPETGTPIAIEMELQPDGGYRVPRHMEQYVPVKSNGYGVPLAFREGYATLMEDLFGQSGLQKSTVGRALTQFGAIEKHTTLAADLYHLAKMGYFAAATMWGRAGWKSGYGALEYRPTNMAEAVSRGLLRQKDMDWALATEPVNIGGTVSQMSHYDISKFLQEQGLNVGRVQDAMYKHFVDELDVTLGGKRIGLGRYTRFLFDKFTRGIMNQAAVDAFVRHNKDLAQGGAPVPAERIAKKVVGDINTMFGSAGKQAMIKNPTLRDINQLIWLAPQWTGTRISMEAKALSRLATVPYKAARYGLPEARLEAGPIGKAVGTGLLAMFGITQVLNMAFNGWKTTFQNPEEGHKLDAHVRINGEDHWISPLSVFMETLHDVLRFTQVKEKGIPETITAIAGNKLHPVARGLASALTGFTPTGQKITTMGGRLKALGTGMVPVPISFGSLSRFIGHKLTDRIAPNPPGAGVRQAFSTIGVKSEVGERPAAQIQKLADAYMKRNNLKPPSGWQQIQTDEPNYSKLRSAIRAGDTREARNLIRILSESHPPIKTATGTKDAVVHAMEVYAKHNFASKRDEADFKASLTPGQRRIYEDAKDDREIELQKFYDLYDSVR